LDFYSWLNKTRHLKTSPLAKGNCDDIISSSFGISSTINQLIEKIIVNTHEQLCDLSSGKWNLSTFHLDEIRTLPSDLN